MMNIGENVFTCISAGLSFNVSSLNHQNKLLSKICKGERVVHIFGEMEVKPITDSFFQETEDQVFLFDGVLANSGDLVTLYGLQDTQSLLKTALQCNPSRFISQFHGQFAGLYLSWQAEEFRIFTNQTNSKRIYFYHSDNILIAGTSLKTICRLILDNGIPLSVDEIGARMILSFGYTLSDFTTVKEIKQLRAGHYLQYANDRLDIIQYHQFNNDVLYGNLSQVLPNLDELFRKAVACAFRKDDDNGREHFAFLSGGLDSRQTVFTATQLGYEHFTCMNFSQPGYADETIARQIARTLGLDLIFYPLTNGDYLLHVDENLQYNDGQIILHGAAHLFEAISSLNLDRFGILHSGQLGDVVFGSYLTSSKHEQINFFRGAYSSQLLESILPEIEYLKAEYPNHELYLLYNRGFNAITNGDLACSVKSCSISPFLYPEFAQLGFNISPELRYKSHCYFAWMKQYYPAAARFSWEKTGSNLYTPALLAQMKQFVHRVMNKAQRSLTHSPNRQSMNPFDYWWKENHKLRDHFTPQWTIPESMASRLSPDLQKDMRLLLMQDHFSEKLQVYTLMKGLDYLGLI